MKYNEWWLSNRSYKFHFDGVPVTGLSEDSSRLARKAWNYSFLFRIFYRRSWISDAVWWKDVQSLSFHKLRIGVILLRYTIETLRSMDPLPEVMYQCWILVWRVSVSDTRMWPPTKCPCYIAGKSIYPSFLSLYDKKFCYPIYSSQTPFIRKHTYFFKKLTWT